MQLTMHSLALDKYHQSVSSNNKKTDGRQLGSLSIFSLVTI